MIRVSLALVWVLGASCRREPPPPDPVPTADTGDTGTTIVPTGAIEEASCVPQTGNVLRQECTVRLWERGPTSVSFREEGTEPWIDFPSSVADALEHVVVLYDLKPDTTYEWVSGLDREGPGGTFTTGVLPEAVDVQFEPALPVPLATERLLFPFMCGQVVQTVIVDRDGLVRWYQGTGSIASVGGFDFTDRSTVMTVTGRTVLTETALDGTTLLQLDHRQGDLPVVHHDVLSRNGVTTVLTAESQPLGLFDWVIDGVLALDVDGNELWSWESTQVFDPTTLMGTVPAIGYWAGQFDDALDFGHANSIEVDDAGDFLVSFKHLNTVLKVRGGDPSDPEFGTAVWRLVGDTSAGVVPDLLLGSTAGLDPSFVYQHHAHWTDAGTLLLVDNGNQGAEGSRVIEIEIDEDLGTADVVREWDMRGYCPVQSSAWLLDDGSLIAACASDRRLLQFAPGSSDPEIDSVVDCSNEETLRTSLVRAMPVPALSPPIAP